MAGHDLLAGEYPGLREACEITQRLAVVVLARVGPPDAPPADGYSRRRLALDAGVSNGTITNLLNGVHFPQIQVLTKLLSALQLPLDAVLPARRPGRR